MIKFIQEKIKEGRRLSQEERIWFLIEKFSGWRPQEVEFNFCPEPIKEDVGKILVIKPDPIGDVVFSIPAILGLRERLVLSYFN